MICPRPIPLSHAEAITSELRIDNVWARMILAVVAVAEYQRHDDRRYAAAEHGHDHQAQDEMGQRVDGVTGTHQDLVDGAADESGDHAHRGAQDRRRHRDDQRDRQRQPQAEGDPDEQVAAAGSVPSGWSADGATPAIV